MSAVAPSKALEHQAGVVHDPGVIAIPDVPSVTGVSETVKLAITFTATAP